MFTKKLLLAGLLSVLALMILTAARSEGDSNLAKVRKATAGFHRISAAQSAGYGLVPGLDHCFNNPGVGAMGFHYINTDLLDTTVEMLKPEALVYAPDKQGRLKLAAVEYIVPADAWDSEGHRQLPKLFGRSFHLNDKLGVYVLHAWIYKHNQAGMFEDWNPRVSCP